MDSSQKQDPKRVRGVVREDFINIDESPQIGSTSSKLTLKLSQLTQSLSKKNQSASKAQSLQITPHDVLQEKEINSDPIVASKQLELGETDVSRFIFESKTEETPLQTSEFNPGLFQDQISQVNQIESAKEPNDKDLIDMVKEEIEQFEFVNRKIEESLTVPINTKAETQQSLAGSETSVDHISKQDQIITPQRLSKTEVKNSSHSGKSKSLNPAQTSTEEKNHSSQLRNSKGDKEISRLYNYSASDQKRSKKSQMMEENEDPINSRNPNYFGINSQIFNSAKKNHQTEFDPTSFDLIEKSPQSQTEQTPKLRSPNQAFNDGSKSPANRQLIPQLQKMLQQNEILRQRRQHSESGKKSKLKRILDRMNSTKNLAGKETTLADRDQEEDKILDRIVQKFQSIEANNSRENSTDKSSFVMLQSEQTLKNRGFDSERMKHYSLQSKFDEYEGSDKKILQRLLSAIEPNENFLGAQLHEKNSIEDSSNLSITKEDTQRVVSETTTKIRSKDDLAIRSEVGQSLPKGNHSEYEGRQFPYHIKHQLTANSAISSIPTSIKSRGLHSAHNRVNSEVKLALPKNKWVEKSNKKKSGNKKLKLERKIKKPTPQPQEKDSKFKKVKDSVEYEKERRSSESHSKKVRFQTNEVSPLKNGTQNQGEQRLSFFNNSSATGTERQTPTFLTNHFGEHSFLTHTLPSARMLVFERQVPISNVSNLDRRERKIVIDSNPMTDQERADSFQRRERRNAVKTKSLSKLASIVTPESYQKVIPMRTNFADANQNSQKSLRQKLQVHNSRILPSVRQVQGASRLSAKIIPAYPNSSRVLSNQPIQASSANILSLIRQTSKEDPYSSSLIGNSNCYYQPSTQREVIHSRESVRRTQIDNSRGSVTNSARFASVDSYQGRYRGRFVSQAFVPEQRKETDHTQSIVLVRNQSCASQRSYICSVSSDSRVCSREKVCIVGNERPLTNMYNSRHSSRSKNLNKIEKPAILIEEYDQSYSLREKNYLLPRIQTDRNASFYPRSISTSLIKHDRNSSLNNSRFQVHHRVSKPSDSFEVIGISHIYSRDSLPESFYPSFQISRLQQVNAQPEIPLQVPALTKNSHALKLKNSKFFKI